MQTESSTDPVNAAVDRASDPPPPAKSNSRGRPRTLDDAKRREICALVAGGCGLREAARYVRCNINTIRREAERNPEFDERLRSSETYAQLSPLRAMQHAVGTHWRAAAWMLERAFPNRFAKPDPGTFGARQARELLNEALGVISSEISDPFKFGRIEKRLRGTFEYYIRAACDRRRTTRGLRQAMKFFDDRNMTAQPFSELGVTVPDFDSLMNASHPQPGNRSPDKERPQPDSPFPGGPVGQAMSDIIKSMQASLQKPRGAECSDTHTIAPSNLNNHPNSDATC